MAHHLEEGSVQVSWTEHRKVTIGYHDCKICGQETPRPSMADMIKFAQKDLGCFMWPGKYWAPPGWQSDYEYGLICPECVEVKEVAFSTRKKSK